MLRSRSRKFYLRLRNPAQNFTSAEDTQQKKLFHTLFTTLH